MPLLEVVRRLDADSSAAVQTLVRTATADGRPSIDAHRLRQVTAGEAADVVVVLAWDESHRTLIGYVQAVRGAGGWDVEHVAARDTTARDSELTDRLVRTALEAITGEDGGDVRLWAYHATATDDRRAAGLGMYRAREIRQMERPLPVNEPVDITTRPFVVGRDEPAWLELNNRAFDWHPDQGGWTLADIRAREREQWFDPAGFLLHERAGRLAGFCWTKIHRDTTPAMGEIYVIAVDPDWHGTGLGRALTLAGLDHLAREGLTVGMLYVEATNAPAVRLYEDLGFAVQHVDRVYRTLDPTG